MAINANRGGFGYDLAKDAGARALTNQKGWSRRKNTLVSLANAALQVIQIATVYAADGPQWISAVLLGVGFVAEIILHAGMKGSVTPSNIEAIAKEAESMTQDSVIETETPDRSHVTSFSDNAPELEQEPSGAHALRERIDDAVDRFSSYIR